MQSRVLDKIGRMHRRPQYTIYLHPQHTKYYSRSSNHQASKPFAKPKRSRYVFPPAAPYKSRHASPKLPQARQAEGSRWRSKRKWHDWATEYKFIVYGLVIFSSGVFVICCFALRRVPITGRWQLDYIPHWVALRMEKSKREKEAQLRPWLMKNSLGSDRPEMQGVLMIFNRLLRASGLDDRDWEFRVVFDPKTANAGVSHDTGLVLVYSGMFPDPVKTDDELAAVLAHEIAHVLANHVKEEKSWKTVSKIVSLPFMPFALLGQYVVEALIFASSLVVVVSFTDYLSRRREEEADYIGMMLMVDAGFDPSAAVSVWKKFKETEDRELSADPRLRLVPQWMSTHPHSASRIRENERWIPEVLEILGKESSDNMAVQSANLTTRKRRWEEFLKKRNESQSINRGT